MTKKILKIFQKTLKKLLTNTLNGCIIRVQRLREGNLEGEKYMFINKYYVRVWKNDGTGSFKHDLTLAYTKKDEAIEVFKDEAKRLNAEVTRLDRELGTGRAVGEQYRVTLAF